MTSERIGIRRTRQALSRIIRRKRAALFAGPFEKPTDRNACETWIHEMAHARLLGMRRDESFYRIEQALVSKNRLISDLHEVRALAVEVIVSRRLGCRIPIYDLIVTALRNLRIPGWVGSRLNVAVKRAEWTPKVKRVADDIVEAIIKADARLQQET